MTHIPGVISSQSNIVLPGPYSTKFLMNFENGDGTTPSNDDTGTATLSWSNMIIKNSPTSPGPKFGNGFLEATNPGYLKTNNLSDYNIGAYDFCLEGFIYVSNSTGFALGILNGDISDGSDYLIVRASAPNSGNNTYAIERKRSGTVTTTTYGSMVAYNNYVHFALTGESGKYYLYIDGVLHKSITDGLAVSSNSYKIWFDAETRSDFDSLRFISGYSVYSGPFTPPSSALSEISG